MAAIARSCAQSLRKQCLASTSARSFSSAAVARKDFVQELYLRELKGYKPSASASATGQVREFSMPSSPQAPAVPSGQELAKEMENWESAPVFEQAAPVADSRSEESVGQSADEFLAFLEKDHPPAAGHH